MKIIIPIVTDKQAQKSLFKSIKNPYSWRLTAEKNSLYVANRLTMLYLSDKFPYTFSTTSLLVIHPCRPPKVTPIMIQIIRYWEIQLSSPERKISQAKAPVWSMIKIEIEMFLCLMFVPATKEIKKGPVKVIIAKAKGRSLSQRESPALVRQTADQNCTTKRTFSTMTASTVKIAFEVFFVKKRKVSLMDCTLSQKLWSQNLSTSVSLTIMSINALTSKQISIRIIREKCQGKLRIQNMSYEYANPKAIPRPPKPVQTAIYLELVSTSNSVSKSIKGTGRVPLARPKILIPIITINFCSVSTQTMAATITMPITCTSVERKQTQLSFLGGITIKQIVQTDLRTNVTRSIAPDLLFTCTQESL